MYNFEGLWPYFLPQQSLLGKLARDQSWPKVVEERSGYKGAQQACLLKAYVYQVIKDTIHVRFQDSIYTIPDDVNIMGGSIHTLKENAEALVADVNVNFSSTVSSTCICV